MRRAAVVTTISEATRDDLRQWLSPALWNKVRVVPNCVGAEFTPTPKEWNANSPVFLQVGTGWNKNLVNVARSLIGACRRIGHRRLKVLGVNLRRRPMRRSSLAGFHEPGWATEIHMGALLWRCQQGGDVEPLAGVAPIHMTLRVRQSCQFSLEGNAVIAAHAIMQGKRRPCMRQGMCHRLQGRDANATCQQQRVLCVGGQCKVIARGADLDHLPHAGVAREGARTTTPRLIAQDANHIAMCFLRVVAQAVLANQPIANVHIDVRPSAERGQRLALRVDQFKGIDVCGFPSNLFDLKLQGGRVH